MMSNSDLLSGARSVQDFRKVIFKFSDAYFHVGTLSDNCGHKLLGAIPFHVA